MAASAGAILYGSSYVATGFALRSFTPLAAAFWRGAATAFVLGTWMAAATLRARAQAGNRATPALDRPVMLRLLALGLLSGPLFIVGMNVAVSDSGAAVASFVAGLYSLLAALFAPALLKEPLRAAALAGFGVALVGIVLLTGYQPSGSVTGIAFGLLAAITFGLYLVLSRRWSRPWGLDPTVIVLAANVTTAITLLAIELAREPAAILPSGLRPDALAAMVWLVAMVSLLASLIVVLSVRLIPAERSSAFLLLNPPAATLLAWLLLGESLNAAQLAGGALVLAGIGLATVRLSRPGRSGGR